jgi:hypothetical protein
MADHLRQQIVDAIATTVTGLATTSTRVFKERVYALEASNLPGILIEDGAEQLMSTTLSTPRTFVREMRVNVIGAAASVSTLGATLNQIAKEVEIAMAMPVSALAGKAKASRLATISKQMSGDGSQPLGTITLGYDVTYITAENSPDVAY